MACLAVHPDTKRLALLTPLTQLCQAFHDIDPRHVEVIELDMLREMTKVWLTVHDESLDYLDPLLRLESLYPSETLKVFTLNFDLSIEKACKRIGLPYSDGFVDGTLSLNSVPVFGDIGHDLYAEGPVAVHFWKGEERTGDPRVELFKLHGSLNWFESIPGVAQGSDAYETYHRVRAVAGGGLSSARSGTGPLARIDHMSGSVFFSTETFHQVSLYFVRLVFGATVKYLPAVPFIRMYELLYRYLRRAVLCIVIGYSFQDEHVNTMLRDAFNRWAPEYTARLNLLLVDPAERPIPCKQLGLSDPNRIWQIVGPASKALTHCSFHSLVSELVEKGKTTVPHIVRL